MNRNTNASEAFQPCSREELSRIVSRALSCGGDWADLYFEKTEYSSIMLRDSAVGTGSYYVDCGCGIRVLQGEKTGYAYSESTDLPSLMKAAQCASRIALHCSSDSKGAYRSCGIGVCGRPYRMLKDWRDADISVFAGKLEELDSIVRQSDSRVKNLIAVLSYSVCDVVMYNSLGELTRDTRPMGSLNLSVVFAKGGRTCQNSVSRSFRMGAEFLTDKLIRDLASDAVRGIDDAFEARRPRGGVMNVVMGAGASGILLHEAMGHSFEADHNRKGQSPFADKMGKRVAPEGVNIVDDGTLVNYRGSISYDDEGVPARKTYMVRDGILCSFLHDRISARYYGVEPTGNGRRESFRYNPIPRMRSTYMESSSSGTCLEDLIHEAGNGIYVDQFSNGEVKIGEGDFTFYVKSGRLIENGRLTRPINDINIIGNGPQALMEIRGVGSDLKVDEGTWTCGKGQNVAVSCGIPSVLIGGLTVGGE